MSEGNLQPSPLSAGQCAAYWEDRARRYGTDGGGLAAVCSYGMCGFYNHSIDFCQRLALRPWLKGLAGAHVLDVGCGVGRWSRLLAAQGACVTGVDISPTMVAEARRRAAAAGLAERCQFIARDIAELDLGARYSLVLGVTVLQHVLDAGRLRTAVRRLMAHLAPGGRMILLEVAPTRPVSRCDGPFFKARPLSTYLALFADCGLELEVTTGVDPMPLKIFFLPHYCSLPRVLAFVGLATVTALSLPVDALFGRRCVDASWHKVFVLKHAWGGTNER